MNINKPKPNKREARNSIVLIILLAILISLIYFQFGHPFGINGHVSILNMDTFLYMQYAKAWAEGHPYQFNAVDPPTTGCTSHLYPLILGFFHLIGFHDLSLVDIAFILNMIFYVLSAVCYWFIAQKLCPQYKWTAILLFIFSGHLTLGIFGLSDAGLFLLFTLLTWCTALYRRYILTSIVLFLLPFIRPEGVIIILLLGLLLIIERIMKKDPEQLIETRKKIYVFLFGFLGIVTMSILNLSLTGMITFDSMFGKSIFLTNHWLTALVVWIQGSVELIRELLFAGENTLRLFYMVPLLSGLLILIAVFSLPWDKKILSFPLQIELWFLLCFIVTSIFLMQNTMQMIHNDRYLIWLLPLLYFFLIQGVNILPLHRRLKKSILILFVIFQTFCFPIFLRIYILNCGKTKPLILAYQEAHTKISNNLKMGVFGESGLIYLQKNPVWHMINTGAVTSPYFRDCEVNFAKTIKKIQYNPILQFNFFIKDRLSFYRELYPLITDSTIVEIAHPFESSIKFFHIDWEELGSFEHPCNKNVFKKTKKLSLMDKIDIAYTIDEKRCKYKTKSRYAYTKIIPFMTKIKIQDREGYDAAVGVLGYDIFKFQTIPHQTHWLVVRSLNNSDIIIQTLEGEKILKINTEPVKELILRIDDKYEITCDMQKKESEQNLQEWMIKIPADMIEKEQTQFTLSGDHIVCDYWIYADDEKK